MSNRDAELAERQMDACRCSPSEWVERVHAGSSGEASAWVCHRPGHRGAAVAWVEALTGKGAEFTPSARAPKPSADQLSLFGASA